MIMEDFASNILEDIIMSSTQNVVKRVKCLLLKRRAILGTKWNRRVIILLHQNWQTLAHKHAKTRGIQAAEVVTELDAGSYMM